MYIYMCIYTYIYIYRYRYIMSFRLCNNASRLGFLSRIPAHSELTGLEIEAEAAALHSAKGGAVETGCNNFCCAIYYVTI